MNSIPKHSPHLANDPSKQPLPLDKTSEGRITIAKATSHIMEQLSSYKFNDIDLGNVAISLVDGINALITTPEKKNPIIQA